MTADFDALVAEPQVVFEQYGDFVLALQPAAEHATRNFAIGAEPAWISSELREVLRARMTASVTGRCPGCGGLREMPADAKTSAGSRLFTDLPIRHDDDCRFSDFVLQLLRDRDRPGLEPPDVDVSDEALAPLLKRLGQITADPNDSEEPPSERA